MSDVSVPRNEILQAAAGSALAHYSWHQRGRAPTGYVKGMALAYGLASIRYKQGDRFALEMAKEAGPDPRHDALALYSAEFAALGVGCKTAGQATLRHLFTLLTGLGMRESSGRACEGRDKSASNLGSETAEAGLFQTSFNLRHAHPLLSELFGEYKGSSELLDIFMEGVTPRPGDLNDIGTGEGQEFQHLCKHCPAFAVAFAAVGLRHQPSHWGPILRKEAELRPEAEALFRDVEAILGEQGAI
jgi:hypothetical protein